MRLSHDLSHEYHEHPSTMPRRSCLLLGVFAVSSSSALVGNVGYLLINSNSDGWKFAESRVVAMDSCVSDIESSLACRSGWYILYGVAQKRSWMDGISSVIHSVVVPLLHRSRQDHRRVRYQPWWKGGGIAFWLQERADLEF